MTDATGAGVPGAKSPPPRSRPTCRSVSLRRVGYLSCFSRWYLPGGCQHGFKKFEQTGIVLEVNRNARGRGLQLGALTETVDEGGCGHGGNHRPALGQTVNSQDIELPPLVDRDVYSLLT